MSLKKWWRAKRSDILPGPIYWLARFVCASLRMATPGWEKHNGQPGARIYAGWHGHTFIPAVFFRGYGLWTIISLSRDGEMQNRIFTRFGFKTIRGSTGRGGVKAAMASVKILKEGASMAFTPDGPRGPNRRVQGGVLLMARKSGAAIVPVGTSARWRWLAPTWDSYMVPLPFSRAAFVFGDPIYVPAQATEEEVESIRLQVEEAIQRVQDEADALMGHPPVHPEPVPPST